MKELKFLLNKAVHINSRFISLEKDYRNKPKGEIYQKSYKVLSDHLKHLSEQIDKIGFDMITKYEVVLVKMNQGTQELKTIHIWYPSGISERDIKSLILFKTQYDSVIRMREVEQIISGKITP